MILSTERLHQKLLEWINTFYKETVNEIKLLAYFHCNYNYFILTSSININVNSCLYTNNRALRKKLGKQSHSQLPKTLQCI